MLDATQPDPARTVCSMRLTTIWTMPAMTLRERFRRTGEAALIAFAHRLPRALAYRSFIDTGARYVRSDEVVTDVRYIDVLQRIGATVEGLSCPTRH
jgi:hypothetical protein